MNNTLGEIDASRGEDTVRAEIGASIFASSLDAIVVIDTSDTVVEWNPAAEGLFGWSRCDAMGKRLVDLTVPNGLKRRHLDGMKRLLASGEGPILDRRIAFPAQRRDGTAIHIELIVTSADVSDRKLFVGVMRDITDRPLFRKILPGEDPRDDYLARIIESSADAILSKSTQDVILTWNDGCRRLYGYTAEEAVGRHINLIVPEDLREEEDEFITRVLSAGGTKHFETRRRHKDGTIIDVSLVKSPIIGDGTIVGVSVIARDITERKSAERERAQLLDRLAHSNAELEEFAAHASHDLREPLRAIGDYLRLIEEEHGRSLDPEARAFMEKAQDAAARASRMVDDLLALARVESRGSQFAPVDVADLLDDVIADLASAITKSGAKISVGEMPTVQADGVQLGRVFSNLLGNAIKFRGQAPPEITVGATRKGDGWEFSVADNGIGFEQEYAAKAFLPFKRLHSRRLYEGSGMGLAIAAKIVERHCGAMRVETNVDAGSTFYFTVGTTKDPPCE